MRASLHVGECESRQRKDDEFRQDALEAAKRLRIVVHC